MKNIPDRWLTYKPIGEKIEDTRFICFKVPLEEDVNFTVEPDKRLHSKLLLNKVPNLGLIIDLTNTNKYYDPQSNFENKGIEYYKIFVPGHEIPHKKYCEEFKDIVTKFLEKNHDNEKLIGVHCTHGVNRTGFLVCHHMVNVMKIQPEIALKRFAKARGHPIERPQYLDHINKLNQNIQQSTISDYCHRRLPSLSRQHPYEERKQHDKSHNTRNYESDNRCDSRRYVQKNCDNTNNVETSYNTRTRPTNRYTRTHRRDYKTQKKK